MASSNKVFVSPGVYTSERDLTFVAQSVGVTTLGIVGETLQGPAFEPIFITNFDEYQVYFGSTSPEKYVNTQIPKYETAYIAKSYLQQSNQLFVTRVLGLSGYDAGPSWSITTMGNVNPATISATGNSASATFTFTGLTGTPSSVQFTVPAPLSSVVGATYTNFDNSTSTIYSDIQSYILNEINLFSTGTVGSGTTAQFWGSVSGGCLNSITADSINTVTAITETYGVSSIDVANNTLSASTNDPWFYSQFTYSQNPSTDVSSYFGFGFGIDFSAFFISCTDIP